MTRNVPRSCPVCNGRLALTRLSCPECETELSGVFESCDFCSLDADDREMLRVFLRSRGNMKELERHLGVSYPTARLRFNKLLTKLGLDTRQEKPAPKPSRPVKVEVLEQLARGEITPDEAQAQLR